MKKTFFTTLFSIFFFSIVFSQNYAQRFFYELNYVPNKKTGTQEKVMTILDITDNKSIYRDYTVIAQDSILETEINKMKKSGSFTDVEKLIKMPKFSYRIYKEYPDFSINYVDGIEKSLFGYNEDISFDWKIQKDTLTIENYKCQKATLDYKGRKWTAWFSNDLPFQDGPYKFSGLPGLIVKISDSKNEYSWILKGTKKIAPFDEYSYSDKLYYRGNFKINNISKSKFEKSMDQYKKDPLASTKGQMKQEMLSRKMPGSDVTYGQMLDNQNKILKNILNSNMNPIELN